MKSQKAGAALDPVRTFLPTSSGCLACKDLAPREHGFWAPSVPRVYFGALQPQTSQGQAVWSLQSSVRCGEAAGSSQSPSPTTLNFPP